MRSMYITCAALLGLPAVSAAHHSGAVTYIPSRTTEIEGEVTRVFWRNPHVHLLVRVTGSDGGTAQWDVESNSVSILSRMGITPDVIEIGDRVRVAGWPARRPVSELFATNLLLPSGEEVLLLPGSPARWVSETRGSAAAWVTDGSADEGASERGIFRVWSTNMANPRSFPLFNDVLEIERDYPLTDSARAARAVWDEADNPYLSCDPMGMPRVMGQPYPIEFVDSGDTVVLRIELYDLERRIHMNPTGPSEDAPRSILGRSVGRWDGDTLVVETTRVSWPYFDQSGVPLGDGAVIKERFTPSPDGSRLDYVLTVTDPETFTDPVTLTKYWVWRPGETVQRFDCEEFRR